MPEETGESETVYLDLDDALELYALIIGGTTAQAGDQLRDRGGLESALGRPRNYALYQDADLALQAAALAHGIAESQTFLDANKRLALVAMLTFLEVNGSRVEATDPRPRRRHNPRATRRRYPPTTHARMTASATLRSRYARHRRRATAAVRPRIQADARIRTGDPFITSEVLYQLSYVGIAGIPGPPAFPTATWCRVGAANPR